MEKMEKYCVIYLILLFLLFSFGAASAKTITVDDSGGADFTKIQDAVNVACAGDTIIVKDGTYAEDVRVNKSLTIQSENGTDKTIVESPGLKFNITADEVEIAGFTITGVESLDNAGMWKGSHHRVPFHFKYGWFTPSCTIIDMKYVES